MILDLSDATIVTLRTACRLVSETLLKASPEVVEKYVQAYNELCNAQYQAVVAGVQQRVMGVKA